MALTRLPSTPAAILSGLRSGRADHRSARNRHFARSREANSSNTKAPSKSPALWWCRDYFLLRRWWRVRRSSLRCFFFAMRLRRFLTTEPMGTLLTYAHAPRTRRIVLVARNFALGRRRHRPETACNAGCGAKDCGKVYRPGRALPILRAAHPAETMPGASRDIGKEHNKRRVRACAGLSPTGLHRDQRLNGSTPATAATRFGVSRDPARRVLQ